MARTHTKPGRKPGSIHSELVRDRIRTAMLLNRLTNFVLGRIEMAPHQVTAALGLLKKTVPDLQAIEHSGTIIEEVHTVSAEPLTEEQWQQTYGSGQRLNG
jgi:hypothetical protein